MLKSILILNLLSAVPCFATFDIPSPEAMSRKVKEKTHARYQEPDFLESIPAMPAGSRIVGSHIVFNTKADAFAWAKQTERETKASFGATKFKMIENHQDAKKLQEYVDEIWGAFQVLFPTFVEGLESPHVLVVDTEQTTAYVPSHEGMSLHIVVVMTGMIDKAGGVDQLDKITGNLAHEVAHSVFSHGTPGQEKRIQRFYLQDKSLMGFESGIASGSAEQQQIEKINRAMSFYVSGIENIGEITRDDLLDLPSPAYATPLLQRVWAGLREQAQARQTPACAEEFTSFGQWSRLMMFSPYNFKYEVRPDSVSLLQTNSTNLVNNGKRCFVNPSDFAKTYADTVGVSVARLMQDPGFQQMNSVVTGSSDTLTGMRELVRSERVRMKAIEQQPFFSKLGFYTVEQHADDASAIVHAYLGRNAGAFGELLRVSMSRSNPRFPQTCDESLQQNDFIPDIGSFLISHHSNCYRIWNFARMKKRMSTMTRDEIRGFAQQFAQKSIR